jgi:hypothetical protein
MSHQQPTLQQQIAHLPRMSRGSLPYASQEQQQLPGICTYWMALLACPESTKAALQFAHLPRISRGSLPSAAPSVYSRRAATTTDNMSQLFDTASMSHGLHSSTQTEPGHRLYMGCIGSAKVLYSNKRPGFQ